MEDTMTGTARARYEYKFVGIGLDTALLSDTDKPVKDYHEVIKKHAAAGWRFVQVFAPCTQHDGRAAYFELIFERRVPGPTTAAVPRAT